MAEKKLKEGSRTAYRLDLDALQIFDMVMRERSVTRVADRLAITQPAVSHALTRLRREFDDKLFVRTAKGVKPTGRAESLWNEVRGALDTIRGALTQDKFDPRTASVGISIAMNDMIVQLLAPDWYARLSAQAPLLQVSVITRKMGDTENRLLQGTLDFGVGIFFSLPAQIRRVALWADRYVLVYRKGNRLLQGKWDEATFRAIPQVAISPDGEPFTYADTALRYAGIERLVRLSISHFSGVPAILQKTDLAALLPAFYALGVRDRFGLEMRELPFNIAPFKYELIWHDRVEGLPSHRWFRDQFVEYSQRYLQIDQ